MESHRTSERDSSEDESGRKQPPTWTAPTCDGRVYDSFELITVGTLREDEDEMKPTVTFADVGGLDKVKQMLMEVFLWQELSRAILLFGPPGCGKTLIVKALANWLDMTLLTLGGAELSQKSTKDVVAAVNEVFYRARENRPSMIFMDEVESLAPSKEARKQSTETRPILQLLIEMDGVRDLRVLALAATHKPQWIDAPLLRRFDKVVYVPPPDVEARRAIFRICLGKSPSSTVNYDRLAEVTDGYSGADISAIVKDAKMIAVRDTMEGVRNDQITMQDLMDAIRKTKPSITTESLQECQRFLETRALRSSSNPSWSWRR